MKRQPLPDDVLAALAAAGRSRGWNTRSEAVKRFDLGDCTLYVVPFCRWAYRRIEKQAAEYMRAQAEDAWQA